MTGSIESALQALTLMDRPALVERWTKVFGSAAPSCRSPFLRGALAWHLQAQAAAPKASSERLLRPTSRPSVSATELAVGTRLVREWQGRAHQVTVLAKGFEYAGRPYRSLSAIAREITGTSWSGPAFFGLR